MDIQAIQQGLANAAATITGLSTFPSIPDSINPPTFAPVDLEMDYNQNFGGSMVLVNFTCGVFVSEGNTPTGRAELATYLAPAGATSIKAALEADKTLGGAAKTLNVDRVLGAYRIYNIGGTDYLGANFSIRVYA